MLPDFWAKEASTNIFSLWFQYTREFYRLFVAIVSHYLYLIYYTPDNF